MRIQAMAAQGGGGGGEQRPVIQNLARQGSIYNLTLSEVENHLGEPLHSMNLDELLRNVLPAEGSSGNNPGVAAAAHHGSGPGIPRQGSITMTRDLSKKTVDEVWRDIRQKKGGEEHSSSGRERQPTLGEMTLEDFLKRAGVVKEGGEKRRSHTAGETDLMGAGEAMAGAQGFTQGMHWLQQYHQVHQQQAHQSMMGTYAYPEARMSISPPLAEAMSDPQTPGRKRRPPEEIAERTVERRQKRMIKNRESAARSRARKQAYTHELENKVSHLEEEIERLKKQRELDTILRYVPPPEPKIQLRRTSSSSF